MTPKEELVLKGVQLAQTAYFKQAGFDINNSLWSDVKAKLPQDAILFFETKNKESIIMADEKKDAELRFQEYENKLATATKALDEKTLAFQNLEKAVSEKDAKLKEQADTILAFMKKAQDDKWEATKLLMPKGMYFKEKDAESRKLWESDKDAFYGTIMAFKAGQKSETEPEGDENAGGKPEAPEQCGLGSYNLFTKKYETE